MNYTFSFFINDFKWSTTYLVLSPKSLPCQSNLSYIAYPRLCPLNVLQIIAVGLSFYFLAFYNAANIYPIECPSITCAFQPNPVNFLANTSVLCWNIVYCDWPNLFISINNVRLFNLWILAKSAAYQILPYAI